jgi:hypothetical protein
MSKVFLTESSRLNPLKGHDPGKHHQWKTNKRTHAQVASAKEVAFAILKLRPSLKNLVENT